MGCDYLDAGVWFNGCEHIYKHMAKNNFFFKFDCITKILFFLFYFILFYSILFYWEHGYYNTYMNKPLHKISSNQAQ